MKEDRLKVRSLSILLSVVCGWCLIFHVITLASPRWLIASDGHAGIWMFCPSALIVNETVIPVTGNDNITCSALQTAISIAVIVFYFISVLLTVATMALVIHTVVCGSQKEQLRLRYAFIFQCLSTFLLVIVLIMKSVSPLEYNNEPASLGWPYFVAIITTFLHAWNCVLLVFQIRRLQRGPEYIKTDTAELLRTPSTRQRLTVEVFSKEEMEASKP